MLIVQRMQVLAELIISNESRIIESNSVSFYNRMRSFQFTATIRYQVPTFTAVHSVSTQAVHTLSTQRGPAPTTCEGTAIEFCSRYFISTFSNMRGLHQCCL